MRQAERGLDVSYETIRRWVRAGRLEPWGRTPTGQLRFLEEQVIDSLGREAALADERVRSIDVCARLAETGELPRLRATTGTTGRT